MATTLRNVDITSVYDSPEAACDVVARLIDLGIDQKKVLLHELVSTDEDPILAVRLNDAWIALHGQIAADQILDHIATFHMPAPERRDAGAGFRWLFHFNDSIEIGACRREILAHHGNAFSPGAEVIERLGAVGVRVIPMAFCAIIHKLDVRKNDVEESGFFFLQ